MIVIGYQGIGKSSLAGRDRKFIDLESSNFWVDGKRAEDWYKPYCQIAEHLSQQGYIVFTSSHEVVRKQLAGSREVVVVVYPSLNLKDMWLDKLENRYRETGLEKDYKALMNAKDRYEENIQELANSNIPYKLMLTNPDYDLEASLIHFRNRDLNLTTAK
jgi:heat shock protein HspQ